MQFSLVDHALKAIIKDLCCRGIFTYRPAVLGLFIAAGYALWLPQICVLVGVWKEDDLRLSIFINHFPNSL